MTRLSSQALDYVRTIAGVYTQRPAGALLFKNEQYPNNLSTYHVIITDTTIAISNGTTPYTIVFVNKSTAQVAQELSNSPYPIKVTSLSNIQSLDRFELQASGTAIPAGFDIEDISNDGSSVIVRSKRYSVTYNKISALSLSAPYSQGPLLPWWARITKGSFTQLYKGIRYHFGIPEYDRQTWSATWGRPFVDVEGEAANFINKSTIQLARSPVLYRNHNMVLVSANGDTIYPSSIIQDVDTMNGIVYLNNTVTLPKNVLVYYTYYENSLLYRDINLNGHFLQNPYILDKYVAFYALPIKSSSGIERTRGIYHSVGSSLDDAIFNISTDNTNEPLAILGAVNIRAYNNIEDNNITDTRSYGGGLRDDELGQATQKKFKESQYFFDIGHKEGIPYPGSASIVVELPSDLKEVMSLSDIRDKAHKHIAAGVYPIYKFPEEDYYDQFATTDYNADISLMPYAFEYANTGSGDIRYGLTGTAANFLDVHLDLPASGLYSSEYQTTGYSGPVLNNDIVYLSPGTQYRLPYIKGSADAVFSYEYKTVNDNWKRTTVRNNRSVPTGQLSSQSLLIDAQYGYKEIRNLTGLAPYIPSDSFWDDVALSAARTIELTKQLSTSNSYAYITGYIPDIFKLDTAIEPTGTIGVKPLIDPLLVKYDILSSQNFYSGLPLLDSAAYINYLATSGNRFPLPFNYATTGFGAAYNGTYNALTDIHAYARFAHHKVDESYNANTNQQAINLTGTGSWITVNSDFTPSYAYSGAFAIASKVLSFFPTFNLGLALTTGVNRYYNPSTNLPIPFINTYGIGDIDPATNDQYHGSEYVKAFAALYSSQVAPRTGTSSRDLALSGIASWVSYYSNYYSTASYNSRVIPLSWVTTFNKVSELGSTYLDNVCNAIDYLYYGNRIWAGLPDYELKKGTYYHTGFNPDTSYSGDTTWRNTINWPDLSVLAASDSLSRAVSGVYDSLILMEPDIRSTAYQGGIIQPGQFTALRYYLWHSTHAAQNDVYFTGFDTDRLVDTFEIGMAAALKGSLNEDGILVEGGSFKLQHAPFSGQVPSEMLKACAKAIEYYRLVDNPIQERKWTSLAQGLFTTSEALYAHSGGYPYNVVFTTTAAGDPGSRPLGGYLELISQRPEGVFTNEETMAITGQVSRLI